MTKWRDVIRIHPAAEVFPRLNAQEFETVAADIKARGLQVPVKVMRDESNKMVLLDGISRLDMLEANGVELIENGELRWAYNESDEDFKLFELVWPKDESEVVALIRSLNEHRRHLTVESREETRVKIEALLKTNPTRSDRSIAGEIGKSQPYVSKVRHELEKAGDVITVITSTDTKGRAQPRRRSKKQKEPPTPGTGAAPVEPTGREASSDDPAVSAARSKDLYAAAEQGEATPDDCSQGNTLIEEPPEPAEAQAEMSEPAEGTPETVLANSALEAAPADNTPDHTEPETKRLARTSRPRSRRRIHKDLKAFNKAIEIIFNTCEHLAEVPMPELSADQKAEAVCRLQETRSTLQKLATRIKKA